MSNVPFESAIFDYLPYAALVVDKYGVIVMINRHMQEILDEMIGERVSPGKALTSIFMRDADFLMTDLRAAASGGHFITWFQGHAAKSSSRMCFRVAALPKEQRRTENFLLVENRTKSMNRVFSELHHKLRQANKEAAETHRRHNLLKENYNLLEQFSMVAAHDLKAPLLNIALLLEFLQDEYGAILDGPAQDLVTSAKDSAQRLQVLISALLNHARSGAADLNIQKVDVAEAVEGVRHLLAADLMETDGEIRIVGDLGSVHADAHLFGQLLQNILSNGLKYRSSQRSPLIRIERVSARDGMSKLVISDNGRGFDPAQKDRLFQPFKRLSSASKVEGSGVGLSICKTVCQRHGWSIDATGIPDVGASFEISGIDKRPRKP